MIIDMSIEIDIDFRAIAAIQKSVKVRIEKTLGPLVGSATEIL